MKNREPYRLIINPHLFLQKLLTCQLLFLWAWFPIQGQTLLTCNHDETFNYDGNNLARDFTIPAGVSLIELTLVGGDGGDARIDCIFGDVHRKGGGGATTVVVYQVSANVPDPTGFTSPGDLEVGGKLKIVVGQKGASHQQGCLGTPTGGGGGSSGVAYQPPGSGSWYTLAVAGGGGGASIGAFLQGGQGGSNGEDGGDTSGCDGGTGGNGGQGDEGEADAGGGGGIIGNGLGKGPGERFHTNGTSLSQPFGTVYHSTTLNTPVGDTGGTSNEDHRAGGNGYTGGGAGDEFAGGGGGFSGGAAGCQDDSPGGAGGGSHATTYFATEVTPLIIAGAGGGGSENNGSIRIRTNDGPPEANCQNHTVFLNAAGDASISTSDINDGSNDGCGSIASLSVSPNTFNCSDVGPNTITLTVTDNNNNSSTCSATATVIDNINPSISCPADIVVSTNFNQCNAGVTYTVPVGIDNCVGAITTQTSGLNSGINYPVGTTTNTFEVTDVGDNTASCSFTVTVNDTQAPSAVCQNATVQLDAAGNGSISALLIDNGSNDACGIASMSLNNANFNCSDVGGNAVILTVTDNNGNFSTCPATVTVEDNTEPVAVCQNVTVQLDINGVGGISVSDIDNGSGDACGLATLTLSNENFTCENIGMNTVVLTVTDNNNNTNSCNGTVTVEDNIAPVAVCQDVTVQLDAEGVGSITAAQVDSNSRVDACGTDSMDLSQTMFTCSDVGANLVTLTITDNNGNSGTCTATVTVEDTISPVVNCQDLTVLLDANGEGSITPADVSNWFTDACGIASIMLSEDTFNCSNLGLNLITLNATDNSGNSDSCSATVTVEDVTAPIAQCNDVTLILDETGSAPFEPEDLNDGSTDNCGISGFAIINSPSNLGNCGSIGHNFTTLTVFDVNGNSSECSATVLVIDTVAPTALCKDITLSLDIDGNASIPLPGGNIDDGSFDNCGLDFPYPFSLDVHLFDCNDIGPNIVTQTVTDMNGNTSTCSATVTVEDTIAPTVSCNNPTVQLDEQGSANILGVSLVGSSSDNCGAISISPAQISFTTSDTGIVNITVTATDPGGNVDSCVSAVTVIPFECTSTVDNLWVGPATGGNWDVALNWSRGTIPTACDNVVIQNANEVTILGGTSAKCATLLIKSGCTLIQTVTAELVVGQP